MIVKDQLNRKIKLSSFPPKRIISLVPSQTELLADLNLDEQVVGITKFCVHPNEWWSKKTRIGGTKNLNKDKISQLNPDLIIANKEENNKGDIDYLITKYPVWISDIRDFNSALEMISLVGEITAKSVVAKSMIDKIKVSFSCLNIVNKKVAYLIWDNPIMTINRDTFINEMMKMNGWFNVFSGDENRYPEINLDILKQADPDLLFLSSEPYPFAEKHIKKFKEALPNSQIVLVDGEYFSWYGSRLQLAPHYFSDLKREITV